MAHTAAPVIVWFRQDLRLADHPALSAAVASGQPVLPVYILDDDVPWAIGGASRWWLHGSLAALGQEIADRGGRLLLRRGDPLQIIPALVEEVGAGGLYLNRCYDAFSIARETALQAHLGVPVETFNGNLLHEPADVRTGIGQPFKVFTAFWRAAQQLPVDAPLPAPKKLTQPHPFPAGEALDNWRLLPTKPDWAAGFREHWKQGEAGAAARLDSFVEDAVADYRTGHNLPARDGSSVLSPHLHWGEISPRQIHARIEHERHAGRVNGAELDAFIREIGWRDFNHNLLVTSPAMPDEPMRPAFRHLRTAPDPAMLQAWARGLTGYPMVDAGMRQLWTIGWMHNRVRMITASFLVKHLLQNWTDGERWFWDTLVDADLANNAANWQWIAGCGADASPYFRVFNPTLQGAKFDRDGDYIRRWVPELAGLSARAIHEPWKASAAELKAAGVVLGRDYPKPIVDHAKARARALAAFAAMREETRSTEAGDEPSADDASSGRRD